MSKAMDTGEARAAALFCGDDGHSGGFTPKEVTCPGHSGHRYVVEVLRGFGPNYLEMRCARMNGQYVASECQGAMSGVCYHIQAAVIYLARLRGYKVCFFRTADQALRASQMGHGEFVQVVSHKGGGQLFFCYKRDPRASKKLLAHPTLCIDPFVEGRSPDYVPTYL
jgi:hypothetical protein